MTSVSTIGTFPGTRLRRLRNSAWLRELVEEHQLTVQDLIQPLFIQEGEGQSTPIESMPAIHRLSIDLLVKEVKELEALGIPAVALFPVTDPSAKSEDAKEAYNSDNLMCRAIRAIKAETHSIGIIGDVALDPYTSHGQDGLVKDRVILNDETIEVLSKQAVTLAQAGCDIVAPSDMMDGRVGEIRRALDGAGFTDRAILSYTAKYASHFYGPFRDAVGSKAALGKADKRTYQMNPANSDEALSEAAQDIAEGADIIMVKPGMPYLDIIVKIRQNSTVPVFAYQVSGEYAMLKAAGEKGWLENDAALLESLIAFKRAGASAILTYGAKETALLLNNKN